MSKRPNDSNDNSTIFNITNNKKQKPNRPEKINILGSSNELIADHVVDEDKTAIKIYRSVDAQHDFEPKISKINSFLLKFFGINSGKNNFSKNVIDENGKIIPLKITNTTSSRNTLHTILNYSDYSYTHSALQAVIKENKNNFKQKLPTFLPDILLENINHTTTSIVKDYPEGDILFNIIGNKNDFQLKADILREYLGIDIDTQYVKDSANIPTQVFQNIFKKQDGSIGTDYSYFSEILDPSSEQSDMKNDSVQITLLYTYLDDSKPLYITLRKHKLGDDKGNRKEHGKWYYAFHTNTKIPQTFHEYEFGYNTKNGSFSAPSIETASEYILRKLDDKKLSAKILKVKNAVKRGTNKIKAAIGLSMTKEDKKNLHKLGIFDDFYDKIFTAIQNVYAPTTLTDEQKKQIVLSFKTIGDQMYLYDSILLDNIVKGNDGNSAWMITGDTFLRDYSIYTKSCNILSPVKIGKDKGMRSMMVYLKPYNISAEDRERKEEERIKEEQIKKKQLNDYIIATVNDHDIFISGNGIDTEWFTTKKKDLLTTIGFLLKLEPETSNRKNLHYIIQDDQRDPPQRFHKFSIILIYYSFIILWQMLENFEDTHNYITTMNLINENINNDIKKLKLHYDNLNNLCTKFKDLHTKISIIIPDDKEKTDIETDDNTDPIKNFIESSFTFLDEFTYTRTRTQDTFKYTFGNIFNIEHPIKKPESGGRGGFSYFGKNDLTIFTTFIDNLIVEITQIFKTGRYLRYMQTKFIDYNISKKYIDYNIQQIIEEKDAMVEGGGDPRTIFHKMKKQDPLDINFLKNHYLEELKTSFDEIKYGVSENKIDNILDKLISDLDYDDNNEIDEVDVKTIFKMSDKKLIDENYINNVHNLESNKLDNCLNMIEIYDILMDIGINYLPNIDIQGEIKKQLEKHITPDSTTITDMDGGKKNKTRRKKYKKNKTIKHKIKNKKKSFKLKKKLKQSRKN